MTKAKEGAVDIAARELVAKYHASDCSVEELIRGVYERGIWYGRYSNSHTRGKFIDRLISELGGNHDNNDKARGPQEAQGDKLLAPA